MYGRRKPILEPVFSVAPAEGGSGGAGGAAPVLPPGVAPGSAAASVAAPPAGGDGANGAGNNDGGKPAGYVPVAEVAQERAKRHELEQKVAQLSTAAEAQAAAIKAAFGLAPEQQTPEQLQQALSAQQETHRAQLTQLTVHQLAAAAGGDPAALLDSNSFLASIKELQPTDTAGITAAIKAAVERNKTLGTVKTTGAGARDAAQGGNNGGTQASISDLLRAAKS